ncbi:DENN domain-containing protein 3-like isoform X1 [Octopus sinensis]|uniref:DENN domain-containing protein 3-like isoform X1 n=1 Tax=Octopus sinensis TaxID=2607531 RepID=A0A6P7SBI8_9MOLL|nr:DENN domain-containing protein 3-like isoform X1 [Octopus sinensis]XP_029635408.1 DENN domain-containing protein 3-like isoform X1 [Octopus sinensis]XP_036358171.1 DENN domain-containing protein 3-like isoform X1 [Octopus sinensis]XP_036358172.1 DENN domain-containing protein 3-like isoform X1 [Octopus sinensis]XP_036358173.1 DENN domain-containing protein 3-like isoform X1 [Octopus sinensis]
MDERKLKLTNSFIEMMLLVGMDDTTGLCPFNTQIYPQKSITSLHNMFALTYEPKLLSCFSSNVVTHFYPCLVEEILTDTAVSDPKLQQIFPRDYSQSNIETRSADNEQNSENASQSSLLADIENIAHFCFPDGSKVYKKKPKENMVHYLVLTSYTGDRSYATCLTFFREYQAVLSADGSVSLEQQQQQQDNSESDVGSVFSESSTASTITVYIPQCCTLISKQPYFTVMKECLSLLINRVETLHSHSEQTREFQKYIRQLSLTPIPPVGPLSVSLCLFGHTIIIHPPSHASLPIFDLPYNLVFICFSLDTIIKIVTCILTERQIVFASSSFGLLTIITETFCSFIHPFSWEHAYVPIVPHLCLELLDAPVPFIMGCHVKHLHTVSQITDLIIVNIDEGSLSLENTTTVLPEMPAEPVKLLQDVYEKIRFNFDLIEAVTPTSFSHKKDVEFRKQKNTLFNRQIQHSFVELMVNLFRNVVSEPKYFKPEKMLKQQLPEYVPFYTEVFETTLFKRFMATIASGRSTYWSELEVKTRPLSRQASTLSEELRLHKNHTSSLGFVSTWFTGHSTNPSLLIPLIDNIDFCKGYLNSCVDLCTKELQEERHFSERASLIYLRSMFLLACSKHMLAFADLVNLHRTAKTINIPSKLIKEVSRKIPQHKRNDDYHRLLRDYGISNMDESDRQRSYGKSLNTLKLPNHDIQLGEFLQLLHILDVCHCYNMKNNLFTVLCKLQKQTCISPKSLSLFLESWQKNQEHFSRLPAIKKELTFIEWIIAVSSLILTSNGMGYLVLTNRRLLFIKLGSKKPLVVLRIQLIDKIEKKSKQSAFTQIDGLVIYFAEKKTFSAWLKKERDIWYLMLSEVWAAKLYSKDHKDDTAIISGAETACALLAIFSCQHSLAASNVNIDNVIRQMCHFSNLHSLGQLTLPGPTRELLQKKISPCQEEVGQNVLRLLYLSRESRAQLWCSLSGGTVRVFDAIVWELENTFIKTLGDVMCLYSPDNRNIWAGSYHIYIISSESIKCVTQLLEHNNRVVAIIEAERKGLVFTASWDGTIFKWDAESLKIEHRICLKDVEYLHDIQFCVNFLWCACEHKTLMVSPEGVLLKEIDKICQDLPQLVPVQCYHLLTENDEMWIGYSSIGAVYILDSAKFTLKEKLILKHNGRSRRGVTTIVKAKDMMWIGTKEGTIHVYNKHTYQNVVVLDGHMDAVYCLYSVEDRYIISGSGSKDSKIAIWSVGKLNFLLNRISSQNQVPDTLL